MGHRVLCDRQGCGEKNLVYIGENEDLFSSGLTANDLNLIACDSIPAPHPVYGQDPPQPI